MESKIIEICNSILFKSSQANLIALEGWGKKEWNNALDFCSFHGLVPVLSSVFNDIKKIDVSAKEVVLTWYGMAETIKNEYRNKIGIMREMALLFQDDGIDIMFLKGATLSNLYPLPEWRTFSDIDYYLYGKHQEGVNALETHGILTEEYEHHHTQASYKGVLIENHYDFFDCVNHKCNLILEKHMKDLALSEGRTIRYDFGDSRVQNAYSMTPTMNALFLMRHMSAHFVAETIPLRMVYDWSLFQIRNANRVDWERVIDLYAKTGMLVFAENIQYILMHYLKVPVTENPITPTSRYAKRIWESIFIKPRINPYKKYSLLFNIVETRTFLKNRWKHKIVYQNESYIKLFFSYVFLTFKRKIGLLNHVTHD